MENNVKCDDCCGACCSYMGAPPFDDDNLPDDLPEDLRQQMLDYWLFNIKGNLSREAQRTPCFWLGEDGKCIHYEYRPKICRDFEVGSKRCLMFRKEFSVD